jgi:ferric-dicitrate binding protein FerR (iron transport regulator)
MTGEAYFQVKHNEAKPFVVKVNNQIIEDLGTEFNVNAYLNESSVKATLIKGIIKVNEKVLRPGQQALIENGKMAINDVNAEQAIAWKNGIFSFENTDLKEVMKQLARWYNIDIQYEGNIPSMVFGGKITRNTNLSQVLAILQASDIHFKIQNKTLIVMP